MPTPSQFPRSFRHFKARLQVLKRPMVWGSVAVLLVAISFLAEYWNHPEEFAHDWGNRPDAVNGDNSGSRTPDDLTEPANPTTLGDPSSIVDLSTLLSESAPPSPESGVDSSGNPAVSPGLLNSLLPIPSLPNRLPNIDSETIDQTLEQSNRNLSRRQESLSGSGSSAQSSVSVPLDLSGISALGSTESLLNGSAAQSASTAASNGNPGTTSPLQSALDRYAAPAPASDAPTLSNSVTSGNSTGNQQAGDRSSLPLSPTVQPFSSSVDPTFSQQFIPRTSPPPGTTGYTLPPAFRSPTNSSTGYSSSPYTHSVNLQPVPGVQAAPQIAPVPSTSGSYFNQPLPGTGSVQNQSSYSYPTFNYNSDPTSQMAPPAPFSIPRNPPGQYIGGGRINTFANP